jgi:transposase
MGHSSICVYDDKGKQLDIVDVARKKCPSKGKTRIGHVLGWIHGKQEKSAKVRIIIIRKAKDAAERERRRINAEAKKKGRRPMQRTLDAADFTFLLTTLEDGQMSNTELAELYRVRWQIELAFKRLKSLIDLDKLRAKDPELTKTYLLGKMVAAVLLETIAAECRTISPWGLPLQGRGESLSVA